jgi:integrase
MLTDAIRTYLALRRAAGFQLRVAGALLEHFAAFATAAGDTHVRAATALSWAAAAPSVGQRSRRLQVVRRFARDAVLDDRRHEVPPQGAFGRRPPRRMPYIFSGEEIGRLLAAASDLSPRGSLRPRTYATLFGLIASTGLRVSEALRLRLGDVTADGLVIRETKFRKSRMVPLHPTARDALTSYLAERTRFETPDDAVFLSLRGRELAYPTVNAMFAALTRGLGLRARHGRGPRIHDLRHTFAVRSLERCAMDRAAVAQHVLALSTYLGHAHLADTYWYLQATPGLLGDIADAAEAHLTRGAP